jgi:TolB-like protein
LEVFIKKLISLSFLFLAIQSGALFADHKLCIMVYPFENQGDAQYSWVSAGMTESVIADLGNISSVTVITDESRRQAVKEMEPRLLDLANPDTAVKVGQMTGANAIITGGYTVAAGRVRVVVNLVNVESGAAGKTIKLDGALDDIFRLQDRIVFSVMAEAANTQIRDVRKVDVSEAEKKVIEQKQTINPEAYEKYAQGLEKLATDPLEAIKLFQAALGVEPDYIDALIAVGNAYSLTGQYSLAEKDLSIASELLSSAGKQENVEYAKILIVAAYMYGKKGEFGFQEERLLHAAILLEKLHLQDSLSFARILQQQIGVYRNLKDLAKSLDCAQKAESCYKNLNLLNTLDYVDMLTAYGILFRAMGDNTSAIAKFQDAFHIIESIGLNNSVNYAKTMYEAAKSYFVLNRLQETWDYLSRAKDIFERKGMQNSSLYGHLLEALGTYYERVGDKPDAGKCWRMVYELYKRIGYSDSDTENALKHAKRLGY